MPAYTTDAFVLRRRHYGETDNILTLFSRDRGRFSAIAKGARKAISRLSGATELLTLTRFGLASGKSLDVVTQVEVQDSHPGLSAELIRLANALYLADLVDHSVEDHAPNAAVFDLLHMGLILLQEGKNAEAVTHWFELQLLRDLGYAPELSRCIVCQTVLPGRFVPVERFGLAAHGGGALCPRHAHPASDSDHSDLSYNALMTLQALENPDCRFQPTQDRLERKDPPIETEMRLALRRVLRCHLERDLKSLSFLDSLRAV